MAVLERLNINPADGFYHPFHVETLWKNMVRTELVTILESPSMKILNYHGREQTPANKFAPWPLTWHGPRFPQLSGQSLKVNSVAQLGFPNGHQHRRWQNDPALLQSRCKAPGQPKAGNIKGWLVHPFPTGRSSTSFLPDSNSNFQAPNCIIMTNQSV